MDLFGTAGIRGSVDEAVTPDLALAVGQAAGLEAGGASADPVFVLGRDGRVTGPALAAAVEAGLESAGATVRRAGVLPTPTLAFASRGRRGVVLTASHNPPHDNGIKLFRDGVEYDRDAERRVEDRVAGSPEPAAWEEWGDAERVDVLDDYRAAVVEFARDHGAPLDGLPIAVDCGNGVGGLATPQVLRALDGQVTALNANVDGHFPGRASKPTPESIADLRSFVADGPAVLGFAHDGDADRIVVVDGAGEVVHEDTVVAILAEHYVRESGAPDPVVVTTPNASARIDDRVDAAGGRVERIRLGALHEGIAAARAAGDEGTAVAFAAEPWKHIHPGLGGWIDGVATAAVLARLVAAAGGIEALREPIDERPYRKRNVGCPDDRKQAAMDRVRTVLADGFPDATVDTEHGLRLDFPDGSWVLVRPSGTEPYLRIYAESEDVDALVEDVSAAVEAAVEDAGA